MSKHYKVAIVGATGLVGREILSSLETRGFPVRDLLPIASARSAGERLSFRDEEVVVQDAARVDYRGVDIVLMSAGAKVSADIAPKAAAAGAVVVDNSSCWRMDPEVPLVVPEVNAKALADHKKKRIVANPNCSTIQLVVALAPLDRVFGLRRIVVSTYQAVSGRGKAGIDELSQQVPVLFRGETVVPQVFAKQIAFNCVPEIDVFQDDGFTKEEHKLLFESRKILGKPTLGVCATCVRVPVFNGHSESIVAEFEKSITAAEARTILREAPGVMLVDDPKQHHYPTPLDANASDATYVGRIRQDPSAPNSLALWCVADNLRKGAATNAVQIAELLARDYL